MKLSLQYNPTTFSIGASLLTAGGIALGSSLSPTIQPVRSTPSTETDQAMMVPKPTPSAEPPQPKASAEPELPSQTPEAPRSHSEDSYAYVQLARGVVYSFSNAATEPFATPLNARGDYEMTYVRRVRVPDDPMFKEPWKVKQFSRKTASGKALRGIFLSSKVSSRPLSPELQRQVRSQGAGRIGMANALMTAPHALRLGVDLIAANEIFKNGNGKNATLEKVIVVGDTATVVSHCTDMPLYAYGMHQIARGNEARAYTALTMSHSVNILSASLQIFTGTTRVITEMKRSTEGKRSNPSVFLYSFIDIGMGLYFGLLSAYLLLKARKYKQTTPNPEHWQLTDILACFTYLPPHIQDSMRLFGVITASTSIGLYGTLLMQSMEAPALDPNYAKRIAISSAMGFVAAIFSHGASIVNTTASRHAFRVLLGSSAVVLGFQTLFDLVPNIDQLYGLPRFLKFLDF